MKINGKEFGEIFLAPMAGVSEVGFRHVCKMCSCDLTFTEMVSSKALLYGSKKTEELLISSPLGQPKVAQIFGHEPSVMASVASSELLKDFDLIDINFGCPAPKIVNNGDGSALLKDLPLASKIISACAKASNKPISCKFRKGYYAEDNIAVDFAKMCEDSGAKMITIHGRTKSQMYSGEVDLETIAKVKASVKIPVCGNGDVTSIESFNAMKSTKVDAVMIGRGALGDPNIFRRLKGLEELDKLALIEEHIKVLRKYYSEKFVSVNMKKHLLWYVSGLSGASQIKQQIALSSNLDESMNLIKKLFASQVK